MRHTATDAETRLWSRLRARRLDGWKFRRQHPIGPYILDFYCPDARLAVELDGGQHAEDQELVYDEERTRRLEESGIRVLRLWNDQALKHTDTALEVILRALRTPLTPTLSPRGGEGESHSPLPPGERDRVRGSSSSNPSRRRKQHPEQPLARGNHA